jgi:GH25 family lysozyme M1 (1,4-beta-N-acetylmuramidase)
MTCFVADLGSANPLDLTKLKAASWQGISCAGVILRATRSNGAVDPLFASRAAIAINLDFLVGAYAFNTGETAAVQAARFAATTQSLGVILRALDFETNPSGQQMSLAGAIEFLDRTDQAFGHATWLYSGDRIKTLIVSATEQEREFLAKHPLWGCEYGPAFKCVDCNGKPLSWSAPTLWQFSGDGVGPQPHQLDGLQSGADLSRFEGTREQLAAVWSGEKL